MIIDLTGKNAVVGGSTQGLGKAIAIQLANSGANVTLMARDEVKMQQIVAQLNTEKGQKHQYLKVDFNDLIQFQSIFAQYVSNNHVDILVNNTQGPPAFNNPLDASINDYQQAFNLLFQTTVYATSLVLPNMQERGFGRIINLVSVAAKQPIQNLILSNSIRLGLLGWAKTIATEVAVHQITVNSILTGYFETERLNSLIEKQAEAHQVTPTEWRSQVENTIPAKRLGKPEEFGFLVSFLASENAAYITGAQIPIDGGVLKFSC